MIKLIFKNTMVPEDEVIHCSEESVPLILQWYFGHYSGDDIIVYKAGKRLKLNHYGEIQS